MSSKKGKKQPAGINMMPCSTDLGSFIRARRLELGLRQVPLALMAGLPKNYVSRFEIGRNKFPKPKQLAALAQALQCDVEELSKRIPKKYSGEPVNELGKLIRSRREALGLSLVDFATRIGLSPGQAHQLEVQKSTLGYGLAKLLAKILDLHPAVFVEFTGRTALQVSSRLGQLIRLRRKQRGLSTNKLAALLDVSTQLISLIETEPPRAHQQTNKTIKRLAELLEIDSVELQLACLADQNACLAKRSEKKRERALARPAARPKRKLPHAAARSAARPKRKLPLHTLGGFWRAWRVPHGYSQVALSPDTLNDLERIRESIGVKYDSEIVKKAVQFLRQTLEKREMDDKSMPLEILP